MKMVRYEIVDRQLANPVDVDVPDGTKDFDAWLHREGFGGGRFTLRPGRVIPVTAADIAALGKPSAPLPGYRPDFERLKP